LLLLAHATQQESSIYPLPASLIERGKPVERASTAIVQLTGRGMVEDRETSNRTVMCRTGRNIGYGKMRYRYYVSQGLHHGTSDTGMRVPAREIETIVAERVAQLFSDSLGLIATAWLQVPADAYAQIADRTQEIAARLSS